MATIDRRRLGEAIARRRRDAGISQYQLAAMARVPRPTIAGVETGVAMPELCTAVRLADAFGITVDELIEEARR